MPNSFPEDKIVHKISLDIYFIKETMFHCICHVSVYILKQKQSRGNGGIVQG